MIKQLKQQYLEGLEGRKNLSKAEREKLLKKHQRDLARLERALAREKERQYRKMKEKMILKRLEIEKEKEMKKQKRRNVGNTFVDKVAAVMYGREEKYNKEFGDSHS